ncbi:hypothetical protein [Thalassospira povalilytica]|uniref:Uncharacterized protein n=1 Tax=Thalassospira povalilytica TaxID=732237 RepID=A0A8I1M9A4_9PROT|nr:hypothetical protein [Thalassospira povalilytica]MBN8197750.1 hypothetical protein [Thalassospira povalilytica]
MKLDRELVLSSGGGLKQALFKVVLVAIFVMHSFAFRVSAQDASKANNLTSAQLDEYIQAAGYIDRRKIEQARPLLTQLSKEGHLFAVELLALAEWASKNRGSRLPAPDTNLKLRIIDAWKDSELVPPTSAGNSTVFSALQGIPREYDAAVIDWISRNYQEQSPTITFENVRRLVSTDIEEALYWQAVSLMRIRYEVARCDDVSLSDLPLLWRGYISGALRKLGLENKEKFQTLYSSGLKRVLENWDEVVPFDMKVWQGCRGNESFVRTGRVPEKEWRAANLELREKFKGALAQLKN